MGDRSQMNFYPAPNRFSYGTPKRPSPYLQGPRQPLYLNPSSPHLSPRFRHNRSDSETSSPDFIPLGFSSPRNQIRKGNSWNNSGNGFRNRSNNSSFNSSASYSSFNQSSFGPQRRSRGSFHNSGSFHSNNSGSIDISRYCDKSMLEDPWAELEERERKINEPVLVDTESSSSSSDDETDNQEETGSGASNDGEDDDMDDDDNDDTIGDRKDDGAS